MTTTTTVQDPPKPPLMGGQDKIMASFGVPNLSIEVQGGQAVISAQASYQSKLMDLLHVWRVRVLDLNGNEISKFVYDHQVFAMEADHFMEPTFHDVIDLPAGESVVELAMFWFNKKEDLSFLRNEGLSLIPGSIEPRLLSVIDLVFPPFSRVKDFKIARLKQFINSNLDAVVDDSGGGDTSVVAEGVAVEPVIVEV